MKILLYTHALIWFYQNAPNLSKNAKNSIEFPGAKVYVSMATIWEMAIKTALGKLEIGASLEKFVGDILENGIQILPIETSHIFQNQKLPFHHTDPFDRLIIAQVLVEKLDIVSVDRSFDAYLTGAQISRIW